MNTAQKIIKYFAIAFASLLSVSIIAGIVFGCLGILAATKLIKDNSSVEITCEENESPCLKISLGVSDLEIKKGDKLLLISAKNDETLESKKTHNMLEMISIKRSKER